MLQIYFFFITKNKKKLIYNDYIMKIFLLLINLIVNNRDKIHVERANVDFVSN